MQNINGQWVDTGAIDRLHAYYDKELDGAEWCGFDEELDEDFTMEIRKAQYDQMIDSVYVFKQKYTHAKRQCDRLINENVDLKSQLCEAYNYILESIYMTGWFDCLKKNHELDNYEDDDAALTYSDLPFMNDNIEKVMQFGVDMVMLRSFATKKYKEWKKDNEGIQLDAAGEEE